MPIEIGVILLGEIWDERKDSQVAENAHQSVCFGRSVGHFAESL